MGSFGLVQGDHPMSLSGRDVGRIWNCPIRSIHRSHGCVACRSHLAKVTSALGAHLAAEKG
jgi:hypothetical protein